MLQSISLGYQAMFLAVAFLGAFMSNVHSQTVSSQSLPSGASKSREASESERPDSSSETKKRTSAEIQKALRSAERAMGSAGTDEEKTAGIIALCQLFVEISQHEDLTSNASLQRMSVRLRARLQGVEARTVDELARRKIPEPEEMRAQTQAFRRTRGKAAAASAQHSFANHRKMDSGSSDSTSATSGITGPGSSQSGAGSSQSGAGNAAPGGLPDYGWTLVNLIRQTVRPEYWSTVGGPGKAIYFGHSRALVIHGSWRVQEEVADLLNALRGG